MSEWMLSNLAWGLIVTWQGWEFSTWIGGKLAVRKLLHG